MCCVNTCPCCLPVVSLVQFSVVLAQSHSQFSGVPSVVLAPALPVSYTATRLPPCSLQLVGVDGFSFVQVKWGKAE